MRTGDLNKDRHLGLLFGFFMIVLLFSYFDFFVSGLPETVFTTTEKFDFPANNGSLSFATDGSYEKAIFENSVWSFLNLDLNNSQSFDKISFQVSVEDSKVTIISCRIYNSTFVGERVRNARLSYTVIGHGKQVFNLDLDPKGGDWQVILNGIYKGKNDGWSLSNDGSVSITRATSNVTLVYYGFPDSFRDSTNGFNQIINLHSVLIATTFFVSITVLLATFIKKRKKVKVIF
jgi:hypothetical protein